MSWWTFSTRRLMEESEWSISQIAAMGSETQRVTVARIVNDPRSYRIWEARHELLMKQVSRERSYQHQLSALRGVTMNLVHRKALFHYMRNSRIVGDQRIALMKYLHGPVDYANAIIREHSQFARASVSHSCTIWLGSRLMKDAVFDHWMLDYEKAYNDYIHAFASAALDISDKNVPVHDYYDAPFVQLLKEAAAEKRKQILALPRLPHSSRAGKPLRTATGDTQVISTVPEGIPQLRSLAATSAKSRQRGRIGKSEQP